MKFLLCCLVALIAPFANAIIVETDGHIIDQSSGSLTNGVAAFTKLQTPYKVTKAMSTLTASPTDPLTYTLDIVLYALDGVPATVPLTSQVTDTTPNFRSILLYSGPWRGTSINGANFEVDMPMALSTTTNGPGSHFVEIGADGISYEKTVSHYTGTFAVPQPGLYAQSVVLAPEPTCLAGLFGSLVLFLRRPFRRVTVRV